MSAPAPTIVIPDALRREPKRPPEPEIQNSPEQDIANLAYALWQQRGCPGGSSEQDWLEAEERLQASRQK